MEPAFRVMANDSDPQEYFCVPGPDSAVGRSARIQTQFTEYCVAFYQHIVYESFGKTGVPSAGLTSAAISVQAIIE
jgi:hypothetical protein